MPLDERGYLYTGVRHRLTQRCTNCDHFNGSHIGGSCIVEFVSGPPSPDQLPTRAPHFGRVVNVCGCKEFV